jgi:adenylate cyclase
LFRERTEDGSKPAMALGVTFGRKLNLSQYQREDAIMRRAAGETLAAIDASYGVHISMISLLRPRRPRGCPGFHPAVRGVIRLAHAHQALSTPRASRLSAVETAFLHRPKKRGMLMSLEIERKFLVAHDGWKGAATRTIRIRDGLIANNDGHKARVRIADSTATIALKSRRHGPTRTEFEYTIPCSDAEEIMRFMCVGNILDKVRHFVPHAGLTWHVDVYEGILNGVVLAEIELAHADQRLELPDWIGEEVTGDPRYRKINMRAQRMADLRYGRALKEDAGQ